MNESLSAPRKWLALFGGAGLFLSVQGLLFLNAAPIAGIEHSGWFLNSDRGVPGVGLAWAVVGALVGFGRRDSVREATIGSQRPVPKMGFPRSTDGRSLGIATPMDQTKRWPLVCVMM